MIEISGPARKLLRVRGQTCRVAKVESGAKATVHVTLELCENGKRLAIELDHAAWEQLRERVNRAFVFQTAQPLPGQISFLESNNG